MSASRRGARAQAAAALGALAWLAASAAHAESYPARPIRWIVPYTPAGITDTVTRLVAAKLEQSLGQPVVVENRSGANSIIGSEIVARAAPDGYTFLTVVAAYAANETMYAGKLPYQTRKSFAPVSLVGISPFLLTVNRDLPVRSAKELIDYAKQNPGKLSFGSSGIGAGAHLTTELFRQSAGIDMVHVPYKGTAPALQGVLGGEIQVLVDTPSSLMAQVRAGQLRALGTFSSRRVRGAEEVPTLAESGGPALESSTWVMFLAPAGTPREIVERIAAETARALASPDLKSRFDQLGVEAVGSGPQAAEKFAADEIAKWSEVIRAAHVQPESF
jgi:tripartite-type tricarboxylate transporter receptor subunit TctC